MPESEVHADVARVLAGEMRYDDLTDPALQAVVRGAWQVGIAEAIANLDFESEFRANGWSWSTLDAVGNVVTRR